jgi:hypothetical protein
LALVPRQCEPLGYGLVLGGQLVASQGQLALQRHMSEQG